MHQQLWGYKVEEKLNMGVREQKRLSTADIKGMLKGVMGKLHREYISLQFNALSGAK
jgi:hypothetical protein